MPSPATISIAQGVAQKNGDQNSPAMPEMPKEGETLKGNHTYLLKESLGQGGFATTFLAVRDLAGGNKQCVIKVLKPEISVLEGEAERFRNEGRTLVELGQQNNGRLVPTSLQRVDDYFETADGLHCLVLEYLSGENLHEFTAFSSEGERKHASLSEHNVLAIGLNLSKALSFLEQQSIVHRDVSPDNVIIIQGEGDDLHATLIDFGIAKPHQASKTLDQTFACNPHWAARELKLGEDRLDSRADVWSLGHILIAGVLNKNNRGSDGKLIRCEEPWKEPKPRELSESTWDLLKWMTQKERSNRPTALQTYEEFRKLSAPRPLPGPKPSFVWLVICGLLAIGGAVWWRSNQHPIPSQNPVSPPSPTAPPKKTFDVELSVPKTNFVVNELLQVEVRVSEPCSIKLYSLQDGASVQLFPNRYQPEGLVSGTTTLPPNNGADYQFRIDPPAGEATLVVEATLDSFPGVDQEDYSDGPFRSVSPAEEKEIRERDRNVSLEARSTPSSTTTIVSDTAEITILAP